MYQLTQNLETYCHCISLRGSCAKTAEVHSTRSNNITVLTCQNGALRSPCFLYIARLGFNPGERCQFGFLKPVLNLHSGNFFFFSRLLLLDNYSDERFFVTCQL